MQSQLKLFAEVWKDRSKHKKLKMHEGQNATTVKAFLFEWHIVAKGTQQHNICNISWVLTFLSWRCIAPEAVSPLSAIHSEHSSGRCLFPKVEKISPEQGGCND